MLTGPRSLDTFSPFHGHGFVLNHPKDIGNLGGPDQVQENTPKVQHKIDWDKELDGLKARDSELVNKNNRRRIDITVNVGYTENVDGVVSVIKRVVRETDHLIKDADAEFAVGDMDPSNIQIHVKPWCVKEEYWDAVSSLVRNLKLALFKEGVTYRSVKSNN